MSTEEKLWNDEVWKESKPLIKKSKSLKSKMDALETDYDNTRNKLLEARIKFAFNTRKNQWRDKTVENLKKWHATRGWLEHSIDPSVMYDSERQFENPETFTLLVNVSNDRETYKCQIKSENLPKGCMVFQGDGYYFNEKACMRALSFKNIDCDRWGHTSTRYRSPPRGQLTHWTPKAF